MSAQLTSQHSINPNNIDLFSYAEQLELSELHVKSDPKVGLQAIVAIHNTARGPALGGCRWIEYPNSLAAFKDAMRLAQGMSYKAAMADLPLGGGKAVLIRPKHIDDHRAYFEAFGDFVNDLGGRYITAADSGTGYVEMDIIATKTKYVTGTSADDGDPSPSTAWGVLKSIEAIIKFKFNRDSLENLHIAIQGVGHVGYHLAKFLHESGVKLTIADVKSENVERCIKEFAAVAVAPEIIHEVECDVFAPCALGAIINDKTITKLKTKIIAGAANNQLAESRHGDELYKQGILYAPDYVINAGGLIRVFADYNKSPHTEYQPQINNIYNTLMNVLERSEQEQVSTHKIADTIARERLIFTSK